MKILDVKIFKTPKMNNKERYIDLEKKYKKDINNKEADRLNISDISRKYKDKAAIYDYSECISIKFNKVVYVEDIIELKKIKTRNCNDKVYYYLRSKYCYLKNKPNKWVKNGNYYYRHRIEFKNIKEADSFKNHINNLQKKINKSGFQKNTHNIFKKFNHLIFGSVLSDLRRNGYWDTDLYSEYLKTEYWDKTKEKVLKRHKFKCNEKGCLKSRNLHVHHNNYNSLGYESIKDLSSYCAKHHGTKHKSLKKVINIVGKKELRNYAL